MNLITITGVVRDEGTILVLDGYDQGDRHVHVLADRRPAEILLEALLETGEAIAAVDDYQVRVVPPVPAPLPVPFTLVGRLFDSLGDS